VKLLLPEAKKLFSSRLEKSSNGGLNIVIGTENLLSEESGSSISIDEFLLNDCKPVSKK
jgi:hypothetical protein